MSDYLIFGDVDTRDYGVAVFDMNTDTSPTRTYEKFTVPGRDGDLLRTNSRLENKTMQYMGIIYENFEERLIAFRDALMGQKGYKRLSDSIHEGEFCYGMYAGPFNPKIPKGRDMGKFMIEFSCKPQRYLVEGEEAVEIGTWGETTTEQGSVVTFDAPEGTGFKSLVADIVAVQSGTGTPAPNNVRPITGWAGVNVSVSPTLDAGDATVYPVSFSSAGTVYGGTVDVMSGVLTVDKFFKSFDGTEAGWTKTGNVSQNTNRYYMTWENVGVVGGVSDPAQALCSHLTYLSGNAGAFGTFNSTSNFFTVKDGDGSQFSNDIDTFKAWLAAQNTAGTPLQFCVGLATTQTYQLTPAQVEALLGVNNIWSDAGDVTVEYGADPGLMINPTMQTARPLIRVYGYGTVVVGEETITIAQYNKPYIDIDCDVMDCYYNADNLNAYVSFQSHEFPTLHAGITGITYSGSITKVEVMPRWWRA